MRVSSSWIKKYLGRTMLSDQDIVQAMEQAGLEVEQIISSSEIDRKVIVGLIKKVIQHPQADKLHLVDVEMGRGFVRVVCGAPNVREGMKVALAQVGAVLPGGDRIQKTKLRGEVSEGMLCSEHELGIGDDHNGILELASDVAVGTSLCDIYPADTLIDLKTPANRFDVLSVLGLAREVAAMTDAELLPMSLPVTEAPDNDLEMIQGGSLAQRYMLARIKVSQSSPSPGWLTASLQAAGMRAVSPVVDVTNFVMLELGQPLHAFDASKVKLPLAVRHARVGETLVTLDGVERKLTPEDLVIADQTGPVALAGLMGGANSEVGPETTEILLESAVFDGSTVRKMAKRHGLRTEASARFERMLPVQLPPLATSRAIQLMAQIADGTVMSVADQLNVWPWVQRIGLRVSKLSKLLSFDISHKEAVEALEKLQIEARPFDIVGELHKLIGKPYKLGASYKNDGADAFDCSYLVDYVYSLIGIQVGFTALGQYKLGRPVSDNDLKPGDAVFTEGDNSDTVTDHYFTRNDDGKYEKHEVNPPERIGHVGIYVGDGKVVSGSSVEGKVVMISLDEFTKAPGYAGARRFADDLDDFISVPEVPWWRQDLRLAEDLVEEIVRVLGYSRVPSSIPSWKPAKLEFDRTRSKRRRVRETLFSSGLFEVMTYSFVSRAQLARVMQSEDKHLKLKNPLSVEQEYLRSSLLPSHLSVLEHNRTYSKTFGFYEISKVFKKQAKGEQPNEPEHLGVMIRRPNSAYAHIKGVLDALARELNVDVSVNPQEVQAMAPGRAGVITLEKKPVGSIGQLHPDILRAAKIDGEAAFLEIFLSPLTTASTPRQFGGINRFPTISRDLAVLVPQAVTWQIVADALSGRRVSFVGDYHGQELPQGYKGLTLRLTVANPEGTPTEAEAVELEAGVMRQLKRKFGARPRD